jgi:hypothetical protein
MRTIFGLRSGWGTVRRSTRIGENETMIVSRGCSVWTLRKTEK